jgi:hypothetical protein
LIELKSNYGALKFVLTNIIHVDTIGADRLIFWLVLTAAGCRSRAAAFVEGSAASLMLIGVATVEVSAGELQTGKLELRVLQVDWY